MNTISRWNALLECSVDALTREAHSFRRHGPFQDRNQHHISGRGR